MSVVLSGADFYTYTAPGSTTISNRVSGRVNPNEVTFDMSWDPWYDVQPPVAERLATGALLVVNGTAVTTGTPGHLSGPLRGNLLVYPPGTVDLTPGRTIHTAECNSNNHKFLLSR